MEREEMRNFASISMANSLICSCGSQTGGMKATVIFMLLNRGTNHIANFSSRFTTGRRDIDEKKRNSGPYYTDVPKNVFHADILYLRGEGEGSDIGSISFNL